MNKTEALVALLEKARGWERPNGMPQVDPQSVAEELGDALSRLQVTEEAADEQAQLIIIGAAALYLLVDDVQVVEGRSLDEWLADSRDPIAQAQQIGAAVRRVKGLPPQPVNGHIGRQL